MSETQSENSESSTRAGDWFTVSQAAAALGKSERTTRRMCERGELAATMEANQSGGRAWFIEQASVDRAATLFSGRADVRPNDAATKEMTARPRSKREKSERTRNDAAIVDRADSVRPEDAANVAAMLLREKDARIDDLRAQVESQKLQIEAANRQAAEATAALREYLKLQAKALPSGDEMRQNGTELQQPATGKAAQLEQVGTESSTRNDVETSRENAPQAPQNAAMGKHSQDGTSGAQRRETRQMRTSEARTREMRPLWKVILRVR